MVPSVSVITNDGKGDLVICFQYLKLFCNVLDRETNEWKSFLQSNENSKNF